MKLISVLSFWLISAHADHEFQRLAEEAIEGLVMPVELLRGTHQVVADVAETMREKWPDSLVEPYGSVMSDTATVGSDIDITVFIPNNTQSETTLVGIVRNLFQKHPELYDEVQIPDAKVNIVQAIHIPTTIPIDLSFGRTISINNTEINRYMVNLDKRMFQMAILLKIWAKRNHVKSHQLFTNYDTLCLIIFYLQQKKILPPVYMMQKNAEPYFVNEWNAGFNEIEYHTKNKQSLYKLMGGFFEYYSKFDYDNYALSIFSGYPIEKSLFENPDSLPKEFDLYKYNIKNGISAPLDTRNFTMIECFEHNDKAGLYLNVEPFRYMTSIYKLYNSSEFFNYLLDTNVT